MKIKQLNFKKINGKKFAIGIVTALFCWFAPHNSFAQTLQSPLMNDNTWYSTTNSYPIEGINTALIVDNSGYTNAASVYYDGSGTETIHIVNLQTSSSLNISSANLASVPDVVLGDYFSSTRVYMAATAYVNTSGDVEVDIYTFNDISGALSSASLLGTITISGYGYIPQTVHLDIIKSPVPTHFFLTWDDFSGLSPAVYAQFGDLSSVTMIGSPQLISSSGYMPDIDANSLPGLGDNASIAYLDAGGNALYEADWAAVTSTVSVTPIDNGSTSTSITLPRIAAVPSPISIPPPTTYSYYMVVAQAVNSGTGLNEIRTYDYPGLSFTNTGWTVSNVENITGISPYSTYAPPYNNYLPTIAFTGNGYFISHFMDYNSPGSDVLMMDPMDENVYNSLANPPNYPYYWVNSKSSVLPLVYPSPTDASVCAYANSVSTPANGQSSNSIFAWARYNSVTGFYEVDYKTTIPTTIAFRQSTSSVTNIEGKGWQFYPNPASTSLTIGNTTGTDAATQYQIMDLAGRTAIQGSLPAGTSDIDISRLASGTYILKIYKGDNEDGNALFVKN